jgi:hypothetical protein
MMWKGVHPSIPEVVSQLGFYCSGTRLTAQGR